MAFFKTVVEFEQRAEEEKPSRLVKGKVRNEKCIPEPRSQSRITARFTSKNFPTVARESQDDQKELVGQ